MITRSLLFGICFLGCVFGFNDVDPLPYLSEGQAKGFMIGIPISVIIVGILLIFFGHRIHQSTFFTLGTLIFGETTYLILSDYATQDASALGIIAISGVIGILGGMLFVFALFFVVFSVGALLAGCIGLIFLGFLSPVISSPLSQFLWCFTFVFVGGVTALIFQWIIVVLGTALMGAFMVVAGVDALWLNTEFVHLLPQLIANFFSGKSTSLPDSIDHQNFWFLFASMIFGMIIGSIVQIKLTGATNSPPEVKVQVSNDDYVKV